MRPFGDIPHIHYYASKAMPQILGDKFHQNACRGNLTLL